MAKQNFSHYIKRDRPPKRGPRQHKKSLNKSEKRQKSQKRYLGQGWQTSHNILYIRHERNNNKQKEEYNA